MAATSAEDGGRTVVMPRPGAALASLRTAGGRDYALGSTATLGRLPECEVTLDDPSVSRRHARITSSGTRWSIEDLGSTNGLKVNGDRVGSAVLADGDRLELGTVELTFSSKEASRAADRAHARAGPAAAPAVPVRRAGGARGDPRRARHRPAPAGAPVVAGPAPRASRRGKRGNRPRALPGELVVHPPEGRPQVVPLDAHDVSFGRADASTVILSDPYISDHHARVYLEDGTWLITDLGSTNGTFLNQSKVTAPTPIAAGDQLGIGKTVVQVRR